MFLAHELIAQRLCSIAHVVISVFTGQVRPVADGHSDAMLLLARYDVTVYQPAVRRAGRPDRAGCARWQLPPAAAHIRALLAHHGTSTSAPECDVTAKKNASRSVDYCILDQPNLVESFYLAI